MRAVLAAAVVAGIMAFAAPAEACNTHGYVNAVTINHLFDELESTTEIDVWDNSFGDISSNVTFNGDEVSGYLTTPQIANHDSGHGFTVSTFQRDEDGNIINRVDNAYSSGHSNTIAAIDYIEGLMNADSETDARAFDG